MSIVHAKVKVKRQGISTYGTGSRKGVGAEAQGARVVRLGTGIETVAHNK